MLLLLLSLLGAPTDDAARSAALEGITAAELGAHLELLASPELEGRDSPSRGLEAAARYLEEQFRAYGLEPAGTDGFRHDYTRRLPVPDPAATTGRVTRAGDELEWTLGVDFVPLPRCVGSASGPAVFAGFGIVSKKPRWDSTKGLELEGAIAVILEGEPRHRRLFEGEAISPASDAYAKIDTLTEAGAVGVVIIRRPPAGHDPESPPAAPELGYRYTWASWLDVDDQPPAPPSSRLPVVEVSTAAGAALLGIDVEELAARGDRAGRPLKHELPAATITLATAFNVVETRVDNVVGCLVGSDPTLADEHVVVGAHYDHIGVDSRGRIGLGADDNASGTAALLEIAEACAEARPARSILFSAFSAEEDGLVGSRALASRPPVPLDSMVAMINLDMIGRGDSNKVVVLGTEQNPDLGRVLERAAKLERTGIRRVITNKAAHLWQRSDHYSFHAVGVPVLFFFEAEHESENPDYHTFRDTVDKLSLPKIENTARLAFVTTWLLATDEGRPGPPKE
ncbi:MAG: M28 family peptidase [Planctomycetota bacterium]